MTPPVHRATFDALPPLTAYRIWSLRERVFVVEQACVYADLDARDHEAGTVHLWVEDLGAPVSYLRLLDDGEVARIGRVVTDAAHRGRGLGVLLMRAALEEAGARPCVLSAQAHLQRWYETLGFEACGEGFLEDGIPHLPMRRG